MKSIWKAEVAAGGIHRIPEWVFKALALIGLAKAVDESVPDASLDIKGYWFRGTFYMCGRTPREAGGE